MEDWSLFADSVSAWRLSLEISALALCWSSHVSYGISGIFSVIRVFKGPEIFMEAENSCGAR